MFTFTQKYLTSTLCTSDQELGLKTFNIQAHCMFYSKVVNKTL